MSAVLETYNIAKSYAADSKILPVLGDVSFDLKAGEITVLLGASGCGKTTLLRLLLGIEQPDSGYIETILERPGPEIGYQSQTDQLLPWRTISDNIALGLELAGLKKLKANQQSKALVEQVGLDAFQHSYPHELSGGMKQRALLARILVLQPKLLLLDEPMSNLDIIARQELGEVIKNYVKEKQASALIVTHSVEEACQIANHVLIISRKPAYIVQKLSIANQNDALITVHQALVNSIRNTT